MNQRSLRRIGMAWMAAFGLLAGCSGHPDGTPERSGKDTADREALKRAVITRIANDHLFIPADITASSADVTDLGPQGGYTSAAYRVTGTFSVDSTTPSTIAEAATQRVEAHQCLVTPDHCQHTHFHHTARFDVTARRVNAPDGSVKLTVDGPVFIDEKSGEGQAADTPPRPRRVNTAVSTADAHPLVPAAPVVQAAIVDRPVPPYPPQAIRQHHTGTVTLAITIDANGQIVNVDVVQSSGFRELDHAAQMGVMHWTFRAATQGGIGVGSILRVPVTFDLGGLPSAPAASTAAEDRP
ncbi:energy transducer TonB [Bacillus sp. NP157]|nr:energy transducer TonB [Bacillus sp. NP157]